MKAILIILFLLPVFSFAQTDAISHKIRNRINHQIEQPVHSILVYVDDESKNVIYHEGFGRIDKEGDTVSKDSPFKIASSTKLIVSTIILQLEEEGQLNLNDKVLPYLTEKKGFNFDTIHVLEGVNYSETVTIEQLLSHRSGLADIFTDQEDAFFSMLFQNPEKQYNPKAIMALYEEYNLNVTPHFKPGKGWQYSDINYVLLGLIIEQLDQSTLVTSIRKRILKPLQMEDTFFEFYEAPKNKLPIVQQYVGAYNFSSMNTSFDWSGGGLVSTNFDLVIFIKGLFNLELVSQNSLNKMINVKFTKPNESRYGLGVYEFIINEDTYYGHFGFYGTFVGYCPITKTTISYCISQAIPNFNTYQFIGEVLSLIQGK